MTFDAAIHEVEVEQACEALGLDDEDTAYVLEGHRASDGKLFLAVLRHNGDHRGYAKSMLALRAGLRDDD